MAGIKPQQFLHVLVCIYIDTGIYLAIKLDLCVSHKGDLQLCNLWSDLVASGDKAH